MKTVVKFMFAFAMVAAMTFVSCTTDNPDPSPTDPRDNFVGSWSVSESWNKLSYEVTILNDAASSNGVYIDNFANSGVGVKTHATVSGSSITIAPLPQSLSNGWVVEMGGGVLQATTKINWTYVFNDEATQYSATAVYTKM